jgi:hypothetical protein
MRQDDRPEDTHQSAERSEEVDRAAFLDDTLPGQPLSVLLFVCAAHEEEKAVEFYDPDDPPRCSHGDLMVRKPR